MIHMVIYDLLILLACCADPAQVLPWSIPFFLHVPQGEFGYDCSWNKNEAEKTHLLNRCNIYWIDVSASGPVNLPSSGFHCHLRVVNVRLHVWICESDTAIGYVTRCLFLRWKHLVTPGSQNSIQKNNCYFRGCLLIYTYIYCVYTYIIIYM